MNCINWISCSQAIKWKKLVQILSPLPKDATAAKNLLEQLGIEAPMQYEWTYRLRRWISGELIDKVRKNVSFRDSSTDFLLLLVHCVGWWFAKPKGDGGKNLKKGTQRRTRKSKETASKFVGFYYFFLWWLGEYDEACSASSGEWFCMVGAIRF